MSSLLKYSVVLSKLSVPSGTRMFHIKKLRDRHRMQINKWSDVIAGADRI